MALTFCTLFALIILIYCTVLILPIAQQGAVHPNHKKEFLTMMLLEVSTYHLHVWILIELSGKVFILTLPINQTL